eukprot:10817717-Alexandrium_andersonii.AAC.1
MLHLRCLHKDHKCLRQSECVNHKSYTASQRRLPQAARAARVSESARRSSAGLAMFTMPLSI